MNQAVLFSHAKDEWTTPLDLFAALAAEFGPFDLDAAATAATTRCAQWLGPGGLAADALTATWGKPGAVVFLNPPYRRVRAFIAKASTEVRDHGITVVALIAARTDTRCWHDYIWDGTRQCPRDGVDVRFLKGRLRFGGATASAPFPSAVVILRPVVCALAPDVEPVQNGPKSDEPQTPRNRPIPHASRSIAFVP